MALEYKVTIHTMEIKVHTTQNHKQFYSIYNDKPYLRDAKALGNGTYTMIVNPHLLKGLDADGKRQFRYIPLSEHKQILEAIKQELPIDSLTVTRLDICADPQIDYCYSEKVLRLLVLMLANEISADNRYMSVDPLTLETKTIRVDARKGYNGKTYNGGLQVENYNRGLLDQTEYDNTVINRLEFRASGTEAGENYSPDQIVERWKTRLQAISDRLMMPDRLQAIEKAINQALHEQWRQLVILCSDKPTSKMFNDFVFFNLSSIYTRRQMIELFKLCGDTEQQAQDRNKNIRRLGRKTFRGQLLTEKQLAGELESLIFAINQFSQV